MMFALGGNVCWAMDWSINEFHYQYGRLDIPQFVGGGNENVSTYTLQHANGWRYGDNFIFVDSTHGSKTKNDLYSEGYANFSLGKMFDRRLASGPIADIGLVAGYNFGRDAKILKYLPGFRVAFDLPGFRFLNLDTTAYIDDNRGVERGGAPKEDNSYMFDLNGSYAFELDEHDFSIEGHIEYIAGRDNELGQTVSSHILAQPQFRYDMGKTLWRAEKQFFIGLEYQHWKRKLGEKGSDEYAPQVLIVLQL